MDHPESMEPYFAGVDSLFLVSPMDPRLNTRETAIVGLCKKHGVKHILKMHGAVEHDADELDTMHQGVISMVKESGIPWSMVSPNSVMETSLLPFQETISKGRAIFSCAGDGKIGLVALKDVARVIALVLKTDGHEGKDHVITGPVSLTLTEVASAFTRVLGKEIEYIDMNEEDFSAMIMRYDKTMTPEKIEIEILCHLRAWKRGGADVVTGTFKELTGQEPTTIDEFIRDHYDYFKKGFVPRFIAKSIRKSMMKKK
jgi:uncharacterized protein YbjT (DUF2867 family)